MHRLINENGAASPEMVSSHTVTPANGATPAPAPERAGADALNRAYRVLIKSSWLKLSKEHREALRGRGLSDAEIDRREYCSLPVEDRPHAVKSIAAALGPSVLAVPGFIRRKGHYGEYTSLAGHAGLLIPCRDMKGRIIALKVRADDPKKGAKYSYISSKWHGGPGPGAPVHVPVGITGPAERVRITEGELKADITWALSQVPTISIAGVGAWKSALDVLTNLEAKTVVLAFDADATRNLPVAEALHAFALALESAGLAIELETWNEVEGKGIDDLLHAGKVPDVHAGPAAMGRIGEILQSARSAAVAAGQASASPAAVDTRTKIEITTKENEVNDEAIAALAADKTLFQRAGALVHVVRGKFDRKTGVRRPRDAPRIVDLPLPGIRERLTKVINFVRKEGDDSPSVHPPVWCVKAVAARGEWSGIRYLYGITTFPVLRPDGSILMQPGFDADTGLLFEPAEVLPVIPDQPTLQDARAACDLLCDLVADFPFEKPAHRSAWLAFLLTPFVRHAFDGCVPLFLADANTRGSGKSLLMELVAVIVLGRDFSRMVAAEDDAEMRKKITAVAREGDVLVLIDNVVGTLGNASLDAALTGTTWKDRLLGESKMIEVPLVMIWAASGNNVILAADTSRRVCHIRLRSSLENPEMRTGFRHPNIREHVFANRSKYLVAALTILRAYIVAGRPNMNLPPWGSFEEWSSLVRSSLCWCGLPDPGETREELRSTSDREHQMLRALIVGWRDLDDERTGLTAAAVLDRLDSNPNQYSSARSAICDLCNAPAGKLPTIRQLGNRLRTVRGRVIDGARIDSRDSRGTAHWYVALVENTDSGGSGGSGGSDPTFLARETSSSIFDDMT